MKKSRLGLLIAWTIAGLYFAGNANATDLVLQNGWTHAPFGTSRAEAFSDDGIVYLKGAVAGGTTDVLFTLPPALRPATNVYVSVDLCLAKPGRLWIQPNGVVTVQTPTALADAQCFTSLDGARFAQTASGFTPLTLDYGWIGAPFGTSSPAGAAIDGIVHLKGALANGVSTTQFQLPLGLRPSANVLVPVNLCGAAKGRLLIATDGTVTVLSLNGNLAEAQCFTSLDGVSFASSTGGFTPLSLQNGWTTFPFGSNDAAAAMIDGLVFFQGAISAGSNSVAFTLPTAMRPATNVYVPIVLCSAEKGRLIIQPSGVVSVESAGSFVDAECLSSLDGASFVAPPPSEFTALPPLNGWVNGFYATQTTSVAFYDGIVHFKGALTDGSSPVLFTLPLALRPDADVFVAVDLCVAKVGRLIIQPSGVVSVDAAEAFSDAQCFTSLEGASFARSSNGFTGITPVNGWTGGSFSTSTPAASLINGIVHLKGAMGGGASGFAFTLPPGLRPATDVYLQIGLCGAAKGRLYITASGDTYVLAPELFSDAQCFTSLDGAKFAPSPSGFADQTLLNGWTDMPFGTSSAAASIVRNIVYLRGAIAGGSSPLVFTLPPILRPQGVVYVPIDLLNGAKGRLIIQPSGEVSIDSPGGLPVAQSFTSLDGASFAVPEPAVLPALLSGVLLLAGIRRSRSRRRRGAGPSAEAAHPHPA